MAPKYLYKILEKPPPEPLPGTLPTTDLDTQDGFIHLSTAEQTAITAKLFFSNFDNLWILKLESQAVDGRLEFSTDPNAGIDNGCAHVYESHKGLGRSNVVAVIRVRKEPHEEWTQERINDLSGAS